MNLLYKGFILGLVVGFLMGLILCYSLGDALVPCADVSNLEQQIIQLQEEISTLQDQIRYKDHQIVDLEEKNEELETAIAEICKLCYPR